MITPTGAAMVVLPFGQRCGERKAFIARTWCAASAEARRSLQLGSPMHLIPSEGSCHQTSCGSFAMSSEKGPAAGFTPARAKLMDEQGWGDVPGPRNCCATSHEDGLIDLQTLAIQNFPFPEKAGGQPL